MFSSWVQNHSSDKSCTDSQTFLVILRNFLDFLRPFPDFCPTEIKFRRTFSKFQGKKKNFWGKEFGKYRIISRRYAVSSPQKQVFACKKAVLFRLYSVICDFQTLWESHISQQLFLSSKSRVKWRDTICKALLKSFSFGGGNGIPFLFEEEGMVGWSD